MPPVVNAPKSDDDSAAAVSSDGHAIVTEATPTPAPAAASMPAGDAVPLTACASAASQDAADVMTADSAAAAASSRAIGAADAAAETVSTLRSSARTGGSVGPVALSVYARCTDYSRSSSASCQPTVAT